MRKNEFSFFKGVQSLEELGEFGLISRLSEVFSSPGRKDVHGIGDDCAVLPYSESQSLLVTTDLLVENRHFRRNWISPEDLGYKSLAVSLSDISAMGGKPAFTFLSIAIPEDTSIDWLDRFFQGKYALASHHDVLIPGGDTIRSAGPITINHTVLGFAAPEQIRWRSAAEPGDKICLLGSIGESGAGLKLLSERSPAEQELYKSLIRSHNRPDLHIEEARFLAGSPGVHAMIDLSDGIYSDARHIATQSEKMLRIDIEKLPLSPDLLAACSAFSWPAIELALTAGEDYSLLFTLSGREADKILNEFRVRFGKSFAIIGNVTDDETGLRLSLNGEPYLMDETGFDHFKT